jgi:hypothetical protein
MLEKLKNLIYQLEFLQTLLLEQLKKECLTEERLNNKFEE